MSVGKLGSYCWKIRNCRLRVESLGLKEVGLGTGVTEMNLYHRPYTDSRLFTFAG